MSFDFEPRPILVADDDPDAVACLQQLFAQAGILNPVHVVTDGVEAIAFLEQAFRPDESIRASAPCLLLLDLHMPRRNGFEVLAWLQEEKLANALVVAVLTGSDDPKEMRHAFELGADTFLIKYPNKATLTFLVEQAAHRRPEIALAATGASGSTA